MLLDQFSKPTRSQNATGKYSNYPLMFPIQINNASFQNNYHKMNNVKVVINYFFFKKSLYYLGELFSIKVL